MSHVTNIILTASGEYVEHEDRSITYPCIDAINAWLGRRGEPPLLNVDTLWRGHKNIESGIWIGGFNHLDDSGLIEFVKAQPWDDQEAVQLFVKRHEDTTFRQVTEGGDGR